LQPWQRPVREPFFRAMGLLRRRYEGQSA